MKNRILYCLHRLRSKVMDRRSTEALSVKNYPEAFNRKGVTSKNNPWTRCEMIAFLATAPDHLTDRKHGDMK